MTSSEDRPERCTACGSEAKAQILRREPLKTELEVFPVCNRCAADVALSLAASVPPELQDTTEFRLVRLSGERPKA